MMNTLCLAFYQQWNQTRLSNADRHLHHLHDPAAALAIVFSRQRRWVPHGIFCSLVAFLQSSDNSSSWRLSVCPNNSTKPLCLTRNCIKFLFPANAPGTITLVDAFSHFEVYINAPHNACVDSCPSIWGTLFRGIEKAKENLHYHKKSPNEPSSTNMAAIAIPNHLTLHSQLINSTTGHVRLTQTQCLDVCLRRTWFGFPSCEVIIESDDAFIQLDIT